MEELDQLVFLSSFAFCVSVDFIIKNLLIPPRECCGTRNVHSCNGFQGQSSQHSEIDLVTLTSSSRDAKTGRLTPVRPIAREDRP